MRDAALALPDVDVLLLAAAVADYRPAEALAGKRPKDERGWTVELAPTDDIARLLGRAEATTGSCSSRSAPSTATRAGSGSARCSRRRTPISSSSTTSAAADIGFDAADNEVVLMTRDGDRVVEKASKQRVAAAILDEVERLLQLVGRDEGERLRLIPRGPEAAARPD